jgi:hypothetical protein
MRTSLLDGSRHFVRQRLLDSEAVYEVLEEEEDGVVVAEVVRAPGLERGTRVRFLAKAVAAMERIELAEPASVAARTVAPLSRVA